MPPPSAIAPPATPKPPAQREDPRKKPLTVSATALLASPKPNTAADNEAASCGVLVEPARPNCVIRAMA
ncbi:Uncharacterised protein [Bordetella pertussis]|nr:Uncharacterised protein [Bordetella pertussis]CPO37898.1 Uncharacterised protein [Bordetella pertussis]